MEQLGQFIAHHWSLWLALIIILLFIFINEWLNQKKRAKELSPSAAVLQMNHEDAVVLDIRDAEAYRKGHIIDAQRVSVDDLTNSKYDKYKNKPIILVCARGLQSPALAAKLRAKGFHHIMVLHGGIAAWQAAGLPLNKK